MKPSETPVTKPKPLQKPLQIELRDPQTLTPYYRNSRIHSSKQIDKLAGAIAEFDFDVPIVVDGKGVIIKGHGRREAALQLGLKQVPVIVRSDLTPAQVKAARIADNRIADAGQTDYDAIALEIEDIASLDLELLKYTGFDPVEIDSFLAEEPERSSGGQGRGGGEPGDEDPEEDDSGATPPADKFPLAIVLTASQKQGWDAMKTALKIKGDTDALLRILELGVRTK